MEGDDGRTLLAQLASEWWRGGPTYDERITYLENRSLLRVVRTVVSACALLLCLIFVGMLASGPLSAAFVGAHVAAAVTALYWVIRWQFGGALSRREAVLFVTSSIAAIYSVAAFCEPLTAAICLASFALIATFAALVLTTQAFLLNAALILAALVTVVVAIGGEHGVVTAALTATVLACTTVGAPTTLQFSLCISWQDTTEVGTDLLTGALNRRGLRTTWAAWVMRRASAAEQVCALVIDLDGFKPVNDTYGHAAGDDILIRVTRVLRAIGAEYDATVARLGGDEFALLVLGRPAADCLALAERIRVAITEISLVDGVRVAASIGVSVHESPRLGTTLLDRILADADSAMYQAKRTGDGVALSGRSAPRSDDYIPAVPPGTPRP
ncbi:GGDEF domain-containing protein [Tsukamurella ocularis]|uniref:GGDEF domain-containing protein n=1 Tax=Tsukamurella ocularis TaxID=1970234 RepID=UPI00286DF42C|nr:GGDEF domain-containing protein [Tsukamurella ocularis]MCS3779605.1 diguanylate cyclase (GGDEF)-like protein [Tsukamurella ocularis]MCS3788995.1 diguanylate cyclase (GGDEF)-like protein [Tsukamurella ocularis]MCS3850205.1 diguanylate cyclase (GGDEF)-like protein [Tsukamurella ocularis]